jgi:two-component system, chemotaxis family, CheB/CheR fusion protein
MLIGELNHRVKNVLSTVQAVMSQTLRQSHALDDFAPAFVGRIHAMAQAHDLIADKNWEGTEIGQLVDRTLAPYRSEDRSRIVIEGPPLLVRPQEGVALVMILHELATNAAKYGALSVPTGKLSVIWHRSAGGTGNRTHVRWSETPRFDAPCDKVLGHD